MKESNREIITGLVIGAGIGLLLFHKAVFGADLSTADTELIARTVQAEAGNQDLEGRRLVAATILNRVDHPAFPDDVERVISQDGQFATYGKLEATQATWQDQLAVKMEVETRSNEDVLFFRTGHFGMGEPVLKHQDHYFSTIK